MPVADYPRLPPSWTPGSAQFRVIRHRARALAQEQNERHSFSLRAACASALATHAGEAVFAFAVGQELSIGVEGEINRDDGIQQMIEAVKHVSAIGSTARLQLLEHGHDLEAAGNQATPLRLTVVGSSPEFELEFGYDSALLPELEAQWFLDHVLHMYSQLLVADASPRLSSLSLIPEGEHAWIDKYSTSPPPPAAYPQSCTTLHSFVLNAAREYPNSPALQFDDLVLSFSQLVHIARQLALHILSSITTPGRVVPICIDKSPQMILSMLAVLLAGGAYLNLEPSFPPDRKRGILEELDAEGMLAGVALVQRDQGENDTWTSWNILEQGALDPEKVTRELLEQCARSGDTAPSIVQSSPLPENVRWPDPTPQDAAYVIYTSGTTGKPKGICVEHRNVAAFLR